MADRTFFKLTLEADVEDYDKAVRVGRAINAVLDENDIEGSVMVSRVTDVDRQDEGDGAR
jgi:hypothetical protein